MRRDIITNKWTLTITSLFIIVIAACYFWYQHDPANYREETDEAKELLQKLEADQQPKPTETTETHENHKHASHTTNATYNATGEANNQLVSNPLLSNGSEFDPTTEINIETYRYKNGMYKGMNYREAYFAWKAKRSELTKKLLESSKISREYATALVESSKAERSLMLSMFKNMSPKQLKFAEEVTLKAYPNKSEDIKSFFIKVANHDTTKSLDEISKEADFILKSDQANKIARRQNHAEFDKIFAQLEELNKEKPQMPNLP